MADEKDDPKNMQPMDAVKAYNINLEQEMFCQYYTSPTEFFGSGVQSYAEAYNIDIAEKGGYNVAKTGACRLLKMPKILKRINDLIEDGGFTNENADKQLLFLMLQNADLPSKLGGIREYNKLKQRVTEKIQITQLPPVEVIEITPAVMRDPAVVDAIINGHEHGDDEEEEAG